MKNFSINLINYNYLYIPKKYFEGTFSLLTIETNNYVGSLFWIFLKKEPSLYWELKADFLYYVFKFYRRKKYEKNILDKTIH